MSTDTNSMVSAIIDTTVNNIQEQQKQDAINYQVHQLKVCITDLLAEVEKIEKTINRITDKRERLCK
tara:strand:+ start:103 stop:303 length:201 start_codon:yes stop_codon:yes gene_type:complete